MHEKRKYFSNFSQSDDTTISIFGLFLRRTSRKSTYNQLMNSGGRAEVCHSGFCWASCDRLTVSESICWRTSKWKRRYDSAKQMEWHFVVLSSKLYKNYKNDLEDITEKVKRLEVLISMCGMNSRDVGHRPEAHLWSPICSKIPRTLYALRPMGFFDELKSLRKNLDNEF